jgi:hypothetical protein
MKSNFNLANGGYLSNSHREGVTNSGKKKRRPGKVQVSTTDGQKEQSSKHERADAIIINKGGD